MTQSSRLSNIELLRIFAIIGVLYGHAVGLVLGLPNADSIHQNFISSFFKLLIGNIFIGGVNVFILISGWFGIRANKKGLAKFLFQIIFLLWGIYLIAILIGKGTLNIEGIKWSLGLTKGYWFVMAYLGLYLVSPILNSFAEHATKKQFRSFLIGFYAFQCFFSWITGYVNYFEGYSIVFFCGLYLTARYLRLYPIALLTKHCGKIFITIVLMLSIILLFTLSYFNNAARMARYDNPVVILASSSILLFVSKHPFQSKFINWLASSCFAVYVIHFNPFVFPFLSTISEHIKQSYQGISYAIFITIFIITVYLVCVLIDQLRIFCWRPLQKK